MDLLECHALPITRDLFFSLKLDGAFGTAYEPECYALITGWNRRLSEIEFWIIRNTNRQQNAIIK